MKNKRFVPLLALALCGALVLAGCKKEEAPASSASEPSVPASSSVAAVEPTLPDDSEIPAPSVDGDENSMLGDLTSPSGALGSCLGWGPGTAGSSLKSVQAAVELLNWSEENSLARRDSNAVAASFTGWYEALGAEDKENFSAVWPIVRAQADAILSGEGDMEPLLADAGIDTNTLPDYTAADWETLRDAVDARVPLGGEA